MNTVWTYHQGPQGIAIPVAELEGAQPGPVWLLTAGIHGDEYEGPEAIRRAVASLHYCDFSGRIIALPVANPMAYTAGTRLTPEDGGNLNRAFPGRADGSPTERWADWLWNTFVIRADHLVDLHAGGVTWEFEPTAGFYKMEDMPLASGFGFTLWQMPDTPGVLSREFRQARGPAIGVELGYGGIRDKALVIAAERAIVAAVLGRMPDTASHFYQHHDIVAITNGEWSAACSPGKTVVAGERLGIIRDWVGRPIQEVCSSHAGRVLAMRRIVSVQAGEMVAVIGTSSL